MPKANSQPTTGLDKREAQKYRATSAQESKKVFMDYSYALFAAIATTATKALAGA